MKLDAAFWRWFGESEVVDKNGDPLIVYHGAPIRIEKFNMSRCDIGCHFGTIDQAIGQIGDLGGSGWIMSCVLSIDNPFRTTDSMFWDDAKLRSKIRNAGMKIRPSGELEAPEEQIVRALKEGGYDGVVYLNRFEGDKTPRKDRGGKKSAWWSDKLRLTDQEFAVKYPWSEDSWICLDDDQVVILESKKIG